MSEIYIMSWSDHTKQHKIRPAGFSLHKTFEHAVEFTKSHFQMREPVDKTHPDGRPYSEYYVWKDTGTPSDSDLLKENNRRVLPNDPEHQYVLKIYERLKQSGATPQSFAPYARASMK